ncbi:MAG: FAD-binding oxidoreductase [Myxococcales bacterium]|nr:FAD-binding oxidoreductase [Myxococcales bacterium]
MREVVRGEVRFDAGTRGLYAHDASQYRQIPIGVVVPRDADDVVRAVAACRAAGAPVLTRGGGTSLAGQCCNTAVVLDFSKSMHHVVDVDPDARTATVQPGTLLDALRAATEPYDLTFGPDPSTHDRCTLGGMIGNNACGIHALQAEMYGPGARTGDNVVALDVLTYDGLQLRVGPTPEDELERLCGLPGRRGELYRALRDVRDTYADTIRERFPDIPRRVSGYDLAALLPENGFDLARALCGTEGTCAVVLGATVRLIPLLSHRSLLVLGYDSIYEAAAHIPQVRRLRPVGCEAIDRALARDIEATGLHDEALDLLPEGDGWLLVELGASNGAALEAKTRDAVERLRADPTPPRLACFTDDSQQARIWRVREAALGATAFVPGERDAWPGWEDAAVPPDRLPSYLKAYHAALERFGYRGSLYGHFGQGCVHSRVDFDFATEAGRADYRAFTRHMAEVVTAHGGSLSGEHGDGRARGELLSVMFGDELIEAMRAFRAAWDPAGKLNPRRVVDAAPRSRALAMGRGWPGWRPDVEFSYPADDDDFTHAALRCVGAAKCRRVGEGTMCPSYMVTREERHSTRGRARLLYEMVRGDLVRDGWRSEEVKEALDLCLACKGCAHECPVEVDVATYKAEFLAHYYAGRLRPRAAYAFGLIQRWAPLGARAPGLVNALTHGPGTGALARWAAGMAPERDVPRFARRTFRHHWRRRRAERSPEGRRVVLWADTFNDHFHPRTLAAAAEVLSDAGCAVTVPERRLCCGRPLYDYGMLDEARRLGRRTLDALAPALEAGLPIVGVEPSCVAVFRDELPRLLPDDPRAHRLAELARGLGELLVGDLDYQPPQGAGPALFHGHCHQEAVMGVEHDVELLRRAGMTVDTPSTGCCGMAGAFGFERSKYAVSVAVGERALLPRVRDASDATLIVADGFSCREQIRQLTDRRALHVAEVIQLGLRRDQAPRAPRPEARHQALQPEALRPARLRPRSLIAAAAAALLGAAVVRWARR